MIYKMGLESHLATSKYPRPPLRLACSVLPDLRSRLALRGHLSLLTPYGQFKGSARYISGRKLPPCVSDQEMDGSRGATGSVDVGVSHLNMNINVTGGGLGSVGIQGNSDTAGDAASASSSPPVCKAE